MTWDGRREKVIIGNWKMSGLAAPGLELAQELARQATLRRPSCKIVVCPPATLLTTVAAVFASTSIQLGGQDCHERMNGPHTGSISAEMLKDAGCTHVILGHPERRYGCGETDEQVNAKLRAAWRAGLVAILCVGETSELLEESEAAVSVAAQMDRSMPLNPPVEKLIVAYAPVWAIDPRVTQTASRISKAHRAIRAVVPAATPIIYGGSVKPENAMEILRLDEVDGALVGSASLDARRLWAIVEAYPKATDRAQKHSTN